MMPHSRVALTLLAIAGVAAGLSCKDSSAPKGPTDGPLNVTLTTPNTNDGAVLFTVSGGIMDSVTAPAGSSLQVMSNSATVRTVLVRGTFATGTVVARVWVPNVSVTYTAAVAQVAAMTTYAQRALTGYSLAVSP